MNIAGESVKISQKKQFGQSTSLPRGQPSYVPEGSVKRDAEGSFIEREYQSNTVVKSNLETSPPTQLYDCAMLELSKEIFNHNYSSKI